jgi:hypothetical protein
MLVCTNLSVAAALAGGKCCILDVNVDPSLFAVCHFTVALSRTVHANHDLGFPYFRVRRARSLADDSSSYVCR